MNQINFKKLEERSQLIRPMLASWVRKQSGDPTMTLVRYFQENPGATFPNRIQNADKGDINISLHGPLFNGAVHRHDFFEIIFVAKGAVDNKIGDTVYHLKQNDAMLHNPGLEHSIVACGPDDILINIDFPRSVFARSVYRTFFGNFQLFDGKKGQNDGEFSRFLVFQNNPKEVEAIVDLIVDEYFRNESYSQNVLESAITLLFAEFVRSDGPSEGKTFETKMKKYVLDNIGAVTLEKAAQYFNYHPKYFCSLVKKKTGKSFKQILTEYRLKKSEFYLKHTALSNDAIAEQVGYHDDVSFYNNFKRAYGMTPSAYRKAYAGTIPPEEVTEKDS